MTTYQGIEYQAVASNTSAFLFVEPLPGLPEPQRRVDFTNMLHQNGEQIPLNEYITNAREAIALHKASPNKKKTLPKSIQINHQYFNPTLFIQTVDIIGHDAMLHQPDSALSPACLFAPDGSIALVLPCRF